MKNLIFILLASFGIHSNLFSQNLIFENFNLELNKYGFNIEFNHIAEVFTNLSGGKKQETTHLHNTDFVISSDLENMLGWKGANIITYFLGNIGGVPSEYSGTIQGTSNIAAHDTWKLYEFWIEQQLLDNELSVLIGLYDLNSEFDKREISSIFINPSHGIGPDFALTGENGPSIFPTTALSLRVKYNLSDKFNYKMAVFDGIPGDPDNPNHTHIKLQKADGLLLASELSHHSHTQRLENGYFNTLVGAWYYTSEFVLLNSSKKQKGNWGIYFSSEKFLFNENSIDNQGLSGFFRIGIADTDINCVTSHWGVGLNYLGLFPGRANDIIGFAVSTSRTNSKFRISESALINKKKKRYEYIFELTYSFNLNNYFLIQPDIQYAVNPQLCNMSTSLMIGTRFKVLF